MYIGAPVEIFGKRSIKKPQGRTANVGHYYDKDGSEHFMGVVFQPTRYTWPCLEPGRAGPGRVEKSPTGKNQAQARPGPTKYP
jgi:hypothetical protein